MIPIRSFRIAALALAAVLLAAPASAATAPRLRGMLKTARVVVAGEVAQVTPYDNDRVAVVALQPSRVLKGPADAAAPLQLVELHEGPTRPALAAGMRGIAFLRPAARTSYFDRVLPAGSYYEQLPEFGSFIAADSPAELQQQTALIDQLLAAARGETGDAASNRQLTFGLLAARNPLLVEEADTGLVDLGKQAELTAAELAILDGALLRGDLPERVRIGLVNAVAKGGLREAVPALQKIDGPPPVAEAAWTALATLGAPPKREVLEARLADPNPAVRAAATRELLRRDGVTAVSVVAPIAIQDPDPAVRKATIEALGGLGKPEALPPLERVFSDSGTELKQASGRAIMAVGGQPAIDAFGRLAFVGPVDSQRYAVVLLMMMVDDRAQPVLERIAKTHPDEQTRELLAHGLELGHKH